MTVTNNAANIPGSPVNGTVVVGTTEGSYVIVNPGTAGQQLTSNGPSDPPSFQTHSSPVGGTWVDQTTTSVTMSAGTAYSANNASRVTCTIPATAAFGDEFCIQGYGAGGWKLQANTGQTIHFGDVDSSVAGFVQSNNRYDGICIFCAVANTHFVVIRSGGAALTVG